MRLHQFVIPQGSAPWLYIGVPLTLDGSDVIYLDLCQHGEPVVEYNQNGITRQTLLGEGTLAIDEDEADTLVLHMTQADTLRLETGEVELQIRVRTDDGADTLIPAFGAVMAAYKRGTI